MEKSFKTIFENHMSSLPWLEHNTIFLTKHGSQAYGTNIATSDTDYKGLAIAPKEYYLGFVRHFEQAECKDPDAVIYDLKKFFSLAADCNPNILEVLYTDDEDHVIEHPTLFKKLKDNRDLFLSKKARHTFSGYAIAQLHRINVHYKWLKHPPTACPDRASFGLKLEREMSPAQKDNLATALSMVDKEAATWHDLEWTSLEEPQRIALRNRMLDYLSRRSLTTMDSYIFAARELGFDDNLIDLLRREKEYKGKKQEWDSYQTWLKQRNPARAEIEAKYGYDCKHAMHLCRLLKMCREILTSGEVLVKRPDREELLAIRNGAWPYEQLVQWAEQQDKDLDELYKNCNVLPREPNRNKLDALCQEMIEEFYSL